MTQTVRKIYPVEQKRIEGSLALPLRLPRSTEYLFNRELSLIEFFKRVLDEGLDKTQPLLERLKFLAILSSNLDEFFMIRVSSLKEKFDDETRLSADGKTAAEQLTAIREQLLGMIEMQMKCLREEILPALAERGVTVAAYDSLTDDKLPDLRRE